MLAKRAAELFVVVYRTGGAEDFAWKPSVAIQSKKAAKNLKERLLRSGYAAFVEPVKRFEVLGPPRTFRASLRSKGA